ncbi:FixH family protein [Phenylobacterium sp.]|uniref:FixH family protein n=1 Tax=Phenylobacterium sp. TaxID=1871053 RepID=UPI002897BB00|nr:FixH family protein [Phenylobacterium sp.]
MTVQAARKPFRVTGWHVLISVIAFFGVVIAVDSLFLVLAYRSHPGQVSVTPYEDGLAYNRAVAQRRAQAALGWSATAAPAESGVVVAIADAGGGPVAGLKLTGLLRRPATEAGEFALTFVETAPGRYHAPVRPAAGAWDVHVQSQGQVFQAERRLTWP